MLGFVKAMGFASNTPIKVPIVSGMALADFSVVALGLAAGVKAVVLLRF